MASLKCTEVCESCHDEKILFVSTKLWNDQDVLLGPLKINGNTCNDVEVVVGLCI